MCEWSYMFVDHYNFDRELVDISFNLFDRFLSRLIIDTEIKAKSGIKKVSTFNTTSINRTTFQLISATCLAIAIKIHSNQNQSRTRNNFQITSIIEILSRGNFTTVDMVHMEREILTVLQWQLNPSTSLSYVRYIIEIIMTSNFFDSDCSDKDKPLLKKKMYDLYQKAEFYTETAVFDDDLMLKERVEPSIIAVASVLNAMNEIQEDGTDTNTLLLFHRLSNTFGFNEREQDLIIQVQRRIHCTFANNLKKESVE